MQITFAAVAALTAVVLANPVLAQTPNDAADAPMAGFDGFSHPDVGPDACKVLNPGAAECVIPAKSAGKYMVVASGTSTAKGPGATQTLAIGGKTWICAKVTNNAKWSSGPRKFQMACIVNVLTDTPLPIDVVYQDTNATKDAAGPTLVIHRLPWDGILSYTYRGAQ